MNCTQKPRSDAHWRAPVVASQLRSGAVIACPAEGVWGLSCDPYNEGAVLDLLRLKSRDVSKGLILVAASPDVFAALLDPLSPAERGAALDSWPGANTWLVPHRQQFPDWITGDSHEVAIRVTSAPALAALCRAVGGPLVSTSANPAGLAPASAVWQLHRYFGAGLPVMPGALDPDGKASTIRRIGDGSIVRA